MPATIGLEEKPVRAVLATQSPRLAAMPDDAARMAATLDELPRRIRDIATLRGLGYSLREISEQFGVTPQAVSIMLTRHRRSLERLSGAVDLANLSARAVNALGRHGINSRAQAADRNVLELLSGERNCGRKTLDELRCWLEGGGLLHEHATGERGRVMSD